jgi:hypothetical protein
VNWFERGIIAVLAYFAIRRCSWIWRIGDQASPGRTNPSDAPSSAKVVIGQEYNETNLDVILKERTYIESLLNTRFNYFTVVASIISLAIGLLPKIAESTEPVRQLIWPVMVTITIVSAIVSLSIVRTCFLVDPFSTKETFGYASILSG